MCQGQCQKKCAAPKCNTNSSDIQNAKTLLEAKLGEDKATLVGMFALLDELKELRKAQAAASAVEKGAPVVVRRIKTRKDEGPITGEAITERMVQICGCQGQYDCDCISVLNKARVELWTEYNTGQAAYRNS